ncbi:hypothetical protein D3C76_1038370 [compost metagenome]
MRQVADHAEAATKTLQCQAETKPSQAPGQLLERRLLRQLLFADLEDQPRAQCRVLAQQLIDPLQGLGVGQGRGGQVQRQHLIVAAQVREHFFQHQQIQPRHPAETLQPGQEAAGGQCLALVVMHPRDHFVMKEPLARLGIHHRLEEQLELAADKRLVQARMPFVLVVAGNGGRTLLKAYPARCRLVLGTRQCLVGQFEQRLRGIAWAERRQSNTGDWGDIAGPRLVQALQRRLKGLGKAYRIFVDHPGRQHCELSTSAA